MPLTYEGLSPSGGLGWAGTSAVAFFFFSIELHCNLLPYHPPLPVCVSSHSQKYFIRIILIVVTLHPFPFPFLP